MLQYIIPVISLAALAAGWVAIQFLARKMQTKNHFDDLNSSCGSCNCGGGMSEHCQLKRKTGS
ncbi:MAG: hypothetical protein KDC53_20595 [Saprospiraceae bacterium]|nr:hypothetical protein [Saprospiraceae bacterium]